MPRSSLPSYRLHRPSGQAVTTIPKSGGGRRDVYLGRYGTPESKQEYARILAELQRHPSGCPATPTSDLSVSELLLRFWHHCEATYKDAAGRPTTSLANFRLALRPVRQLYGHTRATDFGPTALKVVRDWHVKAGIIRPEVNRRVERVRAAFKWAVAEQLVPPTVLVALKAVVPLRKGRTTAPDRPPVRPVDEATVRATLPHLSPTVAAMVEVQLLTGARPGEVCRLRPADIDTSGPVWVFKPVQHKTDHLDKDRVIAIGPKAQQILQRFAPPAPDDYYFSPARVEAARQAARRTARPRVRRVRRPRWRPGDCYSSHSYYMAVARGCERAGVEPWAPNRLRHTHGTEVRKRFGLEAAQVVLGHSRASTTEIYAERNLALAAQVAAAVD